MTYTFLDSRDRNLLDHLHTLDTVPLLAHQLKNPHRESTKASVAVAFGLISKATLFTQEMGIGKTFIGMGIIENLLRIHPGKKVMFCGTNDKLEEYIETFRDNLSPHFQVTWTTGAESDVNRAFMELEQASVLISTHSIWDSSVAFHKKFIERIPDFVGIVIDEGGLLFKNQNNYAYRMMEQFVPKLPYRYILNATPIEKDLSLLVNQCRVLGIPIPSKSKLYSEYGRTDDDFRWLFSNLEDLRDKLKYHIFNVSRAHIENIGKVNYDLRTYLLNVTREQQMIINEDGARNIRYPFKYPDTFVDAIYPSLRLLKQICVDGKNNGDKMLVYIRNVEPKKVIKEVLEELGLTVGIYDGAHTDTADKKRFVENSFNQGEYDVLLTNKIYGLNLKTNHIMMYDLPSNFFQFIYRGIRSLEEHN